MNGEAGVVDELRASFGEEAISLQPTRDGIPTVWVDPERVPSVLRLLKQEVQRPYRMLYDLTAIDERVRRHEAHRGRGFTVAYHLLSYDRNQDIRIKTALELENPVLPSVTPLWPSANWYEREVWDMFGIRFTGHPNLRRILLPPTWQGHPLRKDHPARATEMEPFALPVDKQTREETAQLFKPEDWGVPAERNHHDFMFLNMGPHHPGTHGILRVVLELDGEQIVDAFVDIGYHHRGQEKMAERQSWHTYLPYTDRIDYLSGVLNNLPYVLAVEQLGGIEVPDRAKVIRVMLCELFRIISHLVWYGTFVQDLGAMSPVFYTFSDREQAFDIVAAITGFRMHPNWFRIGGVAQDLPDGWERMVREFVRRMTRNLREYDDMVMKNRILRDRTVGIGEMSLAEAIEWGATGPMLRACGLAWDFRKMRPYSGYDQFEFEVPIGTRGDCYDRARVHVEEMRQSLRIIQQCVEHMPVGPYKAQHPLAAPPLKERTMRDIETLIDHFLGVSWGPVIPPGEGSFGIESSKGNYTFHLTSDGSPIPYRARIRTPSFPHLQMLPLLSRGHAVADMIAILGSIDFVVADIDR